MGKRVIEVRASLVVNAESDEEADRLMLNIRRAAAYTDRSYVTLVETGREECG